MSDAEKSRIPRQKRTGSLSVLLSLLLGSCVSIGVFLFVRSWEWQWIERQFREVTEDRTASIEREFSHGIGQLRQVAGYFAGSEEVTRAEFRTYVSSIDHEPDDRWVIQWVPKVGEAQREAYEQQARKDGLSQFTFRERGPAGRLVPAGHRPEYFPVYYQEPREDLFSYVGLDMAADPRKLEVLLRARDQGDAAVLPGVSYGQHEPAHSGLLIVMPVYRGVSSVDSPDARRAGLQGFVVGLTKIGTLLDNALRHTGPRGVIVQVTDAQTRAGEPFVWQYPSREGPARDVSSLSRDALPNRRLRHTCEIMLGDHAWEITCVALPNYEAGRRGASQWVLLVAGLLLTVLIAHYFRNTANHTRSLMTANERLLVEIGERRRFEQSLKENERFLTTLLGNLPGMVYRCRNDQAWTTVFVSDGCLGLTGYNSHDLIGNRVISLGDLIHPEDRQRVWTSAQEALKNRAPFELTYRITTASGAEKWVWERGRGVFAADGSLEFLEGFATDITERKRAEMELGRYHEELEAVVVERTRLLEESREQLRRTEHLASIGTLAAGLAHEINNPVGTMMLAAQNAMELRKVPGTDALVEDCLTGIVKAAKRCGEVIQNVAQFARRQSTTKTPTPIGEVIRRSLDIVAPQANQQGVVIETDIPDGLPCPPLSPLQMEQVFINLLRNAIETGRRGGRAVIRVRAADDQLRITVEDNGPGIAEEDLPRVFDPFFTTRREKGGTGLGLSIVHGIIVEHGGRISVQSRQGSGTTFMIELPLGGPDDSRGSRGQDSSR